jgi:beta-glucanase (GH16 family)
MKRVAVVCMLAALGCGDEAPSSEADAGADAGATQWQLVWSDEFEGSAGAPPDPRYWTPEVGGDGWGNEQLEFNTDRTENAALDGAGNLVITARRELYQGSNYTSARLITRDLVEVRQGRVEARLKMPVGSGMWPAFWMLGANFPETSWPACGEIDVVEYRGQEPGIANAALHGPGYSGGQAIDGSTAVAGGGLYKDFHIFAVEWSADEIVWLVDDYPYHRVTRESLPPLTSWVFDQPFFLLLNLAVGGSYVGPVGADTIFPQALVADYVRAYEVAP